MVRKQIYLERRHDAALKQRAGAAGVTEAEIVRDALDRFVGHGAGAALPDLASWERALRFMKSLRGRDASTPRPKRFTRDQIYAERLERARRPR
jgi:hypothetical protein